MRINAARKAKRKFHPGRIACWLVLGAFAVIALYPVFFLLAGSLMGDDELKLYLGAVISGKGGYADFPLLPLFPTLRHYVEIFMDTPEFFVMFWNSVKIAVFPLHIRRN